MYRKAKIPTTRKTAPRPPKAPQQAMLQPLRASLFNPRASPRVIRLNQNLNPRVNRKKVVFFNSNQAVTKTNGNGNGKILIIKDSYANCFGQFVVDDYKETHLIDLRFFTGKVTDYIRENGITEVLALYNIPNFCVDISAARCFG